MLIDDIKNKIKDNPVNPIGVENQYAVLIPLIDIAGEWRILYELRSKYMYTQPGEISFPGGGVEDGETYKQAAIRETVEELGISKDNIKIIGEIDYLVSNSIKIHCFVGEIVGIKVQHMDPNPDEVDHIFTVPLDYLIKEDPEVYTMEFRRNITREFPYNLIPNGEKYNWKKMKDKIYFYKYGQYVIWGFTARMTRNFIKTIKK